MSIAPKMEPIWSDSPAESAKEVFLRVLLLGGPKIGKSCAAVGTSPGPVYVINSDQPDGTNPVKRVHPNCKFASNLVHSTEKMENALVLARSLVKDGKVKTIVWDTMSNFAKKLEQEMADRTNNSEGVPDGRKFWPMYTKYLHNTIGRLSKLDAHLIVCSHWIDVGTTDQEREKINEGALAKVGPGLVPMLGRTARATIGGDFSDVIFMTKRKVGEKRGERIFQTSMDGVWGVGCRSTDLEEVPPDFTEFLKSIRGTKPKAVKK
jgi:hypothetical protein